MSLVAGLTKNMGERIINVILVIILTAAVVVGAVLGFFRFIVENQNKTVEIVVDYRDLKHLSSISNYPLGKLLQKIKENGVSSIGLYEEDLYQANVLGEAYFASGSGLLRFKDLNPKIKDFIDRRLIKKDKSYIYVPLTNIRKRIISSLYAAIPKNKIRLIGGKLIEIDIDSQELEDIGIGFSESVVNYLTKFGFRIIPRVKNNEKYDIVKKTEVLKGFDTVIFDGEEVLGYPEKLFLCSQGLKKNNVQYGNIEIIKQYGDKELKKLMGKKIVRVHSVPKKEFIKLTSSDVLNRFKTAIKERSIRLIYFRPFLPPVIDSNFVNFNLQFLSNLKKEIEKEGFSLGKASEPQIFLPAGWSILLLCLGVIAEAILLLRLFIPIPWPIIFLILFAGLFFSLLIGAGSSNFVLEKIMAFSATIIFPSYAIISNFTQERRKEINAVLQTILAVINILAEVIIGIFIIVGLLSYTEFMLTSQTFTGVKLALVLPLLIIALFFLLKELLPFSLKKTIDYFKDFLSQKVSLFAVFSSLFVVLVFLVFIGRSGNFLIPVLGLEKTFRILLQKVLFVRPRFKEFLIGYPFLYFSIYYYFVEKRDKFLWLILPIASIALISLLNTFVHIHTPIIISIIRSINGFVLGTILGLIVIFLYRQFKKT